MTTVIVHVSSSGDLRKQDIQRAYMTLG